MGNTQQENTPGKGKRRQVISISIGLLLAMFVLLHRPILLGAIHWFAVRAAARENLKLEFRPEGNVFNTITVRNLRITPTKPDSAVESGDADYIRAEYNLFALLRGHQSELLESIDVRNAHFVINPKPTVKPSPPPHEKVSLPAIFPQRARFEGVSVTVRNHPADLVFQDFNLELNPRVPGELRLAQLQLPTGQSWSRISGGTTYENRNLVLRDIALDNGTKIALLNIDASDIGAHTLRFRVGVTLDAGSVDAQGRLTEEAHSLRVKAQVALRSLSIESLRQFGLGDEGAAGNIENVTVDLAGLLSSPKTWASTGSALVRDLQLNGVRFDRVTAQIAAHDGVATIQPLELVRAGGALQCRGNIELPANADDLGRSPAHFEIAGNNLDLAPITAAMPQPVSGRAQINGTVDVRAQRLNANLKIVSGALSGGDVGLSKLEATVSCAKDLRPRVDDAPWFDAMQTTAVVAAAGAHNAELVVDSISAELEQNGDHVAINRATVQRRQNSVSATGAAQLQANTSDFTKQPAQLNVTINAPQLADFWIAPSPSRFAGALSGSANLSWNGANANGSFNVFGSGLQLRNLTIQQLNTVGSIWQNTIFLNDLTANLNERDFANAHGSFDLRGEKKFAGKLAINIADIRTLKPLLEASGNKIELGGSFVLNWEGRGSLAKLTEIGALKLNWSHGQLGNMKALQANVDAAYSPAGLEMPTFFIGSDRMDFQAIVSAKNETLEVSKIQLDQGQAKYAVGSVTVPFIWKNVGTNAPIFPADGKVAATFETENLDLKKMFDDFGVPPTASGFVTIKLQANGTLSDLRARFDVDARDLRNPKFTNLDPATFRLTAEAAQNKLNITGELKQPKIQPVAIAATVPFDAGKILSTHSLDENTPLQGTVRLPRSSVNFLRQFVPAVEQLDGDIALDAAIGGTIAHPVFSGSGDITINAARFTNGTLPALHGFHSRLVFRDNALVLEKFGGDLAGGPFTLGGRIVFTKLTEPNVDIDLRAESVLVARNDSLTARADANIKVSGPLASATVKGNVALTNSHFLKDIDLLPIGLPGRPAPEPFSEDRPDFSIPDPPMRDWKFDVAITTKDPFSIRGNLANGGAIADLHLGGTGLHPELKGVVRLQNVEATLPFSRLEVTNGFLYFDPSDSFNPKIDLQGTSVIRDYTIRVYVYGSSLAPQAIFTSEPPLPQEEIISLLATGTTRQELTGNNSVLAGRAAMLVVQQLYRKVFKKGQPTESNSMFDRLQLDLGSVDPRTGREQATARFKVNDNWVLVGDLGVGGEFRGLVKYLIRFH